MPVHWSAPRNFRREDAERAARKRARLGLPVVSHKPLKRFQRAPITGPRIVSRKVWKKRQAKRRALAKQERQLREQQLELQQQQDTAHLQAKQPPQDAAYLQAERAAQALVVPIQKESTNPCFPPGFLSIPPDPTPPVSQNLRDFPLFYYKVVTEEQSWDFQSIGQEIPEWTKLYDPASARFYCHNNKTQENAWYEPEGYKPPPKGMLLLDPMVRAAINIQRTYRNYRRSQKLLRHQHQDQTRRQISNKISKNGLPPGYRVSSDWKKSCSLLDTSTYSIPNCCKCGHSLRYIISMRNKKEKCRFCPITTVLCSYSRCSHPHPLRNHVIFVDETGKRWKRKKTETEKEEEEKEKEEQCTCDDPTVCCNVEGCQVQDPFLGPRGLSFNIRSSGTASISKDMKIH